MKKDFMDEYHENALAAIKKSDNLFTFEAKSPKVQDYFLNNLMSGIRTDLDIMISSQIKEKVAEFEAELLFKKEQVLSKIMEWIEVTIADDPLNSFTFNVSVRYKTGGEK